MSYTKSDALYAAQSVYPKADRAREITKGYSHQIFEIETGEYPERVIVKFSNDNHENHGLKKEIRVHGFMQEIGVPVPRILYHDDSKERVPFEFLIMSRAEGVDLDSIWEKLSVKEKAAIFYQLGELLGKIHSKKFERFGVLNHVGIDSKYKFSLKKQGDFKVQVSPPVVESLARAFSDLGMLAAHEFIDPEFIGKYSAHLVANRELMNTSEEPALLHMDVDLQNFRVKKIRGEWRIVCVFDFEYSEAGVREKDFLKLERYGHLKKGPVREALLAGYKKYQTIDEDFDRKVQLYRIDRDVGFCVFLYKAGNKEFGDKILKSIEEKISSLN